MFTTYLKFTLRSLFKNRFYSSIHILGLTLGITSALLILLYATHEMSYDSFHQKSDKIFRLYGKVNYGGQTIHMRGLSAVFGPSLVETNPQVNGYARTYMDANAIMSSDEENSFFENGVMFADGGLFELFDFGIESGKRTDLLKASQVFLTPTMAQKYFGTQDVIGKEILYNKKYPLTVAGLVQSPPSYSSFDYNMIISFSTLGLIDDMKGQYEHDKSSLGSFTTYLELDDPSSKINVEESLQKLPNKSVDEEYLLEPLTSIHLYSEVDNAQGYIMPYLFIGVSFIILLLALINYVNLTTARSVTRSKEIGIRKVIGARIFSLSQQFYTESGVLICIAFFVSIALVIVIRPLLFGFMGIDMDGSFYTSPLFLSTAIGVFVSSILLSGIYPIYVLNNIQPAVILKGKYSGKGKGSWLQKSFTGIQFGVSVGLVLITWVVSKQLNVLQQVDLGLDKEQVMVVKLTPSSGSGFNYLKNNIKGMGDVTSVATSSMSIYNGGYATYFTQIPGTDENATINFMSVDADFVETLGIEWVEKSAILPIEGNLIFNEAAIKKFNFTDDPFQEIALGSKGSKIAAVVADFNYSSPQNQIQAMAMSVRADSAKLLVKNGAHLYIKLGAGANTKTALTSIQTMVNEYQPGSPFEYYFMDSAFDDLFKSEQRISTLFTVFTFLAIIIACLGLFGLVTYSLERRMSEIGIRKVLGASPTEIVTLIFKDYILLFIISASVSLPLVWIAMEAWLENFAYQMEMQWVMPVLSAFLIFILGFTTITLRSLWASRMNPVDSINRE